MRHFMSQWLHVSWLVAALSCGVIVGVILVRFVPYGFFADLSWLGVGLCVCYFLSKQRLWAVVPVIMAGIVLGLWRGSVGQTGLDFYASRIGQVVQVSGRVLEDPDIDKKGQTVLRLIDIIIDTHKLPGTIWVVTPKTHAIKRSDMVMVEGKITEGFAAFAAKMTRANVVSVERAVPGDVAVGVRDWFADRVRMHLPETEAALGMGFLTGLRRALPPDLMSALQIAGLTHVIVASGYNLTILVRLARRLFAKTSKYLATLSAGLMILGFMALTGASPSMSRAGLVSGISLAIWYYGRTIHPFVLLPFAAAITLLINPQYAWGDLGWQLSFAAFAGVMVLSPLLHRYFFGRKPPGNVRQIIGETLSAQIMTLPILIMSFGAMSNVALIANILILPFIPLAMLLTFLLGVVSDIQPIATILSIPTELLLRYMIEVAQWFADQSWAQMEIHITWWQMVMMYIVICTGMWWMWRQTRLDLRKSNIIE